MNPQETYQQRIEGVLDALLKPASDDSQVLQESMRYAVLDGGKRIRPLLVYAAGEALGVNAYLLDKPAAAIELIHAYSLIHDDLPCMDDDDLRRGKPTVHITFDEATAVLAGDALQTLAFEILSQPLHGICATNQLKILQTLTISSGAKGMVKGQMIDLYAAGETLTEAQLETMHNHKTGALIKASVLMPTYCNDVNADGLATQREKLEEYADAIGLAFQVRDDIIDIQSDTETLGKQQGADSAADKPTYPSILGMDAAKEKLYQLHQKALNSLKGFGNEADLLREIAEFIVKRIA
jgi:geranylgeranyl pyrophosphate synthase